MDAPRPQSAFQDLQDVSVIKLAQHTAASVWAAVSKVKRSV